MSSLTRVEDAAPTTIQDLYLEPRGRVYPSPAFWQDHVFYQILPDRFSDGRESERSLYDPAPISFGRSTNGLGCARD